MLAAPMTLAKLRELGDQQARWSGSVSLDAMPRLAGLLGAGADMRRGLDIALSFRRNGRETVLSCTLSGRLPLTCQRCMGWLEHGVAESFELQLADAYSVAAATAVGRFDSLAVDDSGLDLLAVIEDELLGMLPLAPMHASNAPDCVQRGASGRPAPAAAGEVRSTPSETDTHRPFAGLEALLKRQSGRQAGHGEN